MTGCGHEADAPGCFLVMRHRADSFLKSCEAQPKEILSKLVGETSENYEQIREISLIGDERKTTTRTNLCQMKSPGTVSRGQLESECDRQYRRLPMPVALPLQRRITRDREGAGSRR